MSERGQEHKTRKRLYLELERALGRPVVAFFTSFNFPVMLEDDDVDMLADLLQNMDLSNGLALIISSPGGDGLAAERMINVCRNFSGTGNYWTIVPGKAKSAATMVCFGSAAIWMGPTSELGPVDPQVPVGEDGRFISAFNIIESYKELFRECSQSQGNLEPYLQQLATYDAKQIKEYEAHLDLSKDISIRALGSGMMKGLPKKEIEKRMSMFLTPKSKKTHGRPIYRGEASDCGLKIEQIDIKSKVWQNAYELYIRTNEYVGNHVSKCIESKELSFAAGRG